MRGPSETSEHGTRRLHLLRRSRAAIGALALLFATGSMLIGHGALVVLMPAADETRHRVGLYAWVVLEHLARRADPTAPDTAVETSIRAIAAHLAISKDTVTRALQRLIEAGLVDRAIDRNTTNGKFGNAAYRVHLEHAGLRVIATADELIDPRPYAE